MGSIARSGSRPKPMTERGVVTAVNDDGTVDVTVGDRAYPYAGIRGHDGVEDLYLGDVVDLGFIDRHKHGRKWMPFILGKSGQYRGATSVTAPVGGALSWHYSAGAGYSQPAPNGTRQAYRTDTPYTSWRLDSGWSLPATISTYVAYTMGGTGYIVVNDGAGSLTCYVAESAAVAWTAKTDAEYMVYNEDRSELVLIDSSSGSVMIHNPVDGVQVAGPSTVAEFVGGVGTFALYRDRLIPFTSGTGAQGPTWKIYSRTGLGSTSYAHTANTDRATMPRGSSFAWSAPARMTPTGKVPFVVRASRQSGTGLGTTGIVNEQDSCLFMLNVATGAVTVADYRQANTPPLVVGEERTASMAHSVTTMGADGRFYGTVTVVDGSTVDKVSAWSADGNLRADFTGGSGFDLGSSVLAGRPVYKPTTGGVYAIYTESGGLQWTPAYALTGPSTDVLWGGESPRGLDPWVLMPGPDTVDPDAGVDDTWQFRDPRNGRLLAEWAGGAIAMVAGGRIYDFGSGGEMRRWVPA